MDETLTKALHDAQWLAEGLREANGKASAVESLILIPLIAQAADVAQKVRALLEARAE